jgi:hypothetical protein
MEGWDDRLRGRMVNKIVQVSVGLPVYVVYR